MPSRRFSLHHVALLLCIGWAVAATAAVAQVPEVSALFGTRVTASARFPAPFLTGDLDGDGVPDQVYLVTILPASAQVRFAPDVTVLGRILGQAGLGAHGEDLALAIVQKNGRQKFLLTGYLGDGVSDFFGSPIWQGAPPLKLAKRGSPQFRDFQREEKRIRNDILVVGTEAGIDMALYWNGRGYALVQPNEEP